MDNIKDKNTKEELDRALHKEVSFDFVEKLITDINDLLNNNDKASDKKIIDKICIIEKEINNMILNTMTIKDVIINCLIRSGFDPKTTLKIYEKYPIPSSIVTKIEDSICDNLLEWIKLVKEDIKNEKVINIHRYNKKYDK